MGFSVAYISYYLGDNMECCYNSAIVWKITTNMASKTSTIPTFITSTTSSTSNTAIGTNSEWIKLYYAEGE